MKNYGFKIVIKTHKFSLPHKIRVKNLDLADSLLECI